MVCYIRVVSVRVSPIASRFCIIFIQQRIHRPCLSTGRSVGYTHNRSCKEPSLRGRSSKGEDPARNQFKNILVPEINLGQFLRIIRSEFLVDAKGLNLVRGRPIGAATIVEAVNKTLG